MGAYRGAGRPEAAALLERIIDLAADELGIDPVELRRRNFLPPDEFPYTTADRRRPTTAATTTLALTEALELAGYDDVARRAGGAARTGRRGAARHRASRLRRGHRRRGRDRVLGASRCTPTAPPR